ncbi:MAG: hypothetical protein LBB74_07670 [Chitinispirillales bacterium]|jgi:hypothetical protein|nr:hypothetical protein [Chitinispirillales bacterium]
MEKIAIDITDTEDIWAVRKIGLDALDKALGEEDTKRFLRLWSGYGTGRDCVKARHELNKTITNEEIMAGALKLQEEGGDASK